MPMPVVALATEVDRSLVLPVALQGRRSRCTGKAHQQILDDLDIVYTHTSEVSTGKIDGRSSSGVTRPTTSLSLPTLLAQV
jgi:hypothetical protein